MPAEHLKVSADDVEKSFRDSCKDLILVVQRLAIHCNTPSEMVGMLELACENDGQLRAIMGMVTAPTTGKR